MLEYLTKNDWWLALYVVVALVLYGAACWAVREWHFQRWLDEVEKLAEKDGFPDYIRLCTGEECWRESWEQGESPEEAWGWELDAMRACC